MIKITMYGHWELVLHFNRGVLKNPSNKETCQEYDIFILFFVMSGLDIRK